MKTIIPAGATALVAFITLGTVRLVPVTTYGWEDLDTAHSSALTPAERAAGAAVLGHVTDAAEGLDGRVYVLDGMSKKVVIFGQDGSYQRIFGRDGRGPGEFVRPVKLAVSPSGSIYVFDRGIGRLAEFSQDGALLRQVTLSDPNIADLAISDTIVWAARLLIASGPAHLRAFRLSDGTPIQDFTGLTTQEMEISSGGLAGRVLPYGRGGVLFVGPLPVVVRRYSGGNMDQYGSSLYRDAKVVTSANGRTRAATASVRGAALRRDGSLIVSYRRMDGSPTQRSEPDFSDWLTVWDSRGKELGRLNTSSQQLRVLSAARNGDIFLTGDTDYPQLLRMRVVVD